MRNMDSSHRRHDLRSLALHEAAVRVLRQPNDATTVQALRAALGGDVVSKPGADDDADFQPKPLGDTTRRTPSYMPKFFMAKDHYSWRWLLWDRWKYSVKLRPLWNFFGWMK